MLLSQNIGNFLVSTNYKYLAKNCSCRVIIRSVTGKQFNWLAKLALEIYQTIIPEHVNQRWNDHHGQEHPNQVEVSGTENPRLGMKSEQKYGHPAHIAVCIRLQIRASLDHLTIGKSFYKFCKSISINTKVKGKNNYFAPIRCKLFRCLPDCMLNGLVFGALW